MEYKKLCGFEFVKIGEAFLDDEPLKATYNGKPLEGWRLKLKLVVTEEILKAEQSAYLVFKDDELLYVGYYSTSFKDRWWKKRRYFWHGDILDDEVNKLVNDHDISVWITTNPYIEVKDQGNNIKKINISKVIEDEIIAEYSDKEILNTVGKYSKWYKDHSLPVSEILELKP